MLQKTDKERKKMKLASIEVDEKAIFLTQEAKKEEPEEI